MKNPSLIGLIVLALLLARWAVELWLQRLNRSHVLAHAGSVPPAFKESIDETTYAKSVQYTLARSRFSQAEDLLSLLVLVMVLFSGLLPWVFSAFSHSFGESAWAMAAFVFAVFLALTLCNLPLDWRAQFRLEERFGFNTTTPKLWWLDRVKGLGLALALGYPLLVLLLKLVAWTGPWWWFSVWACMTGFQLLILLIAPIWIMPLFNKFTPLPPGSLRERLLALARRTGFKASDIQIMDGSKRSRHSNAFFTGFGRFRKIVLFDTLVQQLTEPELEAVLAHEIGHYQRKHIPKMLAASAGALLLGFFLLDQIARQDWFLRGFGFELGSLVPALVLYGLLSGLVSFWFSPLIHSWSRRYEYQADAYAAEVMGEPRSLIGALRKLTEKNLSNLTPHPLFSGFYYSHPTVVEREKALVELPVKGAVKT